jgi:acetyl esterase/lipase
MNLSRAVKEFLALMNERGTFAEGQSIEDIRKAVASAQDLIPVDFSNIEEEERSINADGLNISLNIVRPLGAAGRCPVFLFIYGGGWVAGNYTTHKRIIRDLALLTGFVGVVVNYSSSPEAKYPQALHEIHAAAKWIMEHGEDIQVDPDRIAIVGNDVGATMSAAVSLMAKVDGGPEFKVQILMCPAMSAGFNTTSWSINDRQQILSGERMKWMWDQYTTDEAQRREIYASPLLATPQQLRGLPPTLIQVAENDILRDEGEAFGRALDDAGVITTTVVYNGVMHDFSFFNGLAEIPQTKSSLLQAAAELKRYLS